MERRCHRGDYAYNFRQFVTMQRRQGLSRARAAWSGVHLLRYAPLDALRVATIADHAAGLGDVTASGRDSLDAIGMFLDRLTAADIVNLPRRAAARESRGSASSFRSRACR